MTDVFISYKREERHKARAVAEALAREGFDVWWDIDLLPGQDFGHEINAILDKARAVLVLWTPEAMGSFFVRAEAMRALELGKYVPATLQPMALPVPFNAQHAADLSVWGGGSNDKCLEVLVRGVRQLIAPVSAAPGERSSREIEAVLDDPSVEIEYWKSIVHRQTQSVDEYRAYLDKYGTEAVFADLATLRIRACQGGSESEVGEFRLTPPPLFPPAWASSSGQDPYGFWCEFSINEVEQLLRWIPPGEFLMGSPENEPERRGNEQLHHVTLTQGYWLADTACTQALWKAVTGANPSLFRGDDRPVERVSWNEIRRFIKQLNAKVPGLNSRLPTEAEWEYAARAGSHTPFWWGATLTSDQANYDGNFPYADGETEEPRKKTVPVRAFEPNPWGLYQVHGNVWEWCEDWFGKKYTAGPVKDPQGPGSGEWRVCRGGGWFDDGGGLRAAFRFRDGPSSRSDGLGFRLCAGQSGAEPQ